MAAALREFEEEIGTVLTGPFLTLGSVREKWGKTVHAWAFEGDLDTANITCNSVSIEWPPRSGRWMEFPEVDRAAFFGLEEARRKVNAAQVPRIDELERVVMGTARGCCSSFIRTGALGRAILCFLEI